LVIFPLLLFMPSTDKLSGMNEAGRSFINRLRKHRRLMGYTQDDVAYLLGLESKTEISRWEKGITIPKAANVMRLAYIYHTFAEELFREFYKEVRYEIEPREKKLAQMRSKRNEQKKKGKY